MKNRQMKFIMIFIGLFCILTLLTLVSCEKKQSQSNHETNAPIREEKDSALQSTKPQDLHAFDLSEFQSIIDDFAYGKNIGAVTSKEDAILQAQTIWTQEFEDLIESSEVSIETEDCVVLYDDQNDCWFINGSIKSESAMTLDAVPCALIKKDGTVLAVWF